MGFVMAELYEKRLSLDRIDSARPYKQNYPAAGAGNVWYFFTRSRPNETQPEEMDILYQGNKVGVKQLVARPNIRSTTTDSSLLRII
ncbi:hypothetical protein QYF36_014048 [Acer negundo]|nr:hypothetical protein QYF36_014048 [Acer negundo]